MEARHVIGDAEVHKLNSTLRGISDEKAAMKRRLQLIEEQIEAKEQKLQELRQRGHSVNTMVYHEKIKEIATDAK